MVFYKLLDHLSVIGGFISDIWAALFPVTLALIIVFFVYGPSLKLESFFKNKEQAFVKKHARGLSLTLIYAAFITLIAVLIRFLLPAIYTNLMVLVNNLPSYLETFESWMKEYFSFFNIDIWETMTKTLSDLLNIDNIKSSFNAISAFFSSIFSIFTATILSIYILSDREKVFLLFGKLARFVLKEHYEKVDDLFHKTANLFYSYFIGLATDAALIGFITMIFLSIVGSDYAFLLGFIVCIGNLIPIFGSIIAAAVVYLLSAVSFGPLAAIWILVFQLVLGQIDGNFIQPRIISRSVNLSPIWIILSVIVFGNLFGAIGMIIGTPLVASVEMVLKALKAQPENEQRTKHEA